MKTNIMNRIYALAMSAVFATVATVGVAVVMTSSGEHAFNAAQSATLSQAHDLTGSKSLAL